MKKNIAISVLTLMVFASLAGADLTSKLILDLQTQQKVTEVEVGASPTQIIQYKNSTLATKTIKEAEINVTFNSAIVENPMVTSRDCKLSVTDGPPGVLLIRLSAPAAGIKVAGGRTVELCRINFHVNQSAPPRMMLRLFNWSGNNLPSSVVRNPDLMDITGALEVFPGTVLAGSAAPTGTGVNHVNNLNSSGISTGDTLLISWGEFTDMTPPIFYQLSRRVGRGAFESLGEPMTTCIYEDKVLENGREYAYMVTATDSTTPIPNVNNHTAIMVGIPRDLNPPAAVQELTALLDRDGILLRWINPADADFSGIVIKRGASYGEIAGIETGKPCTEGKDGVIYIGAPGETSYLDSFAPPGTTSYYKVFTYDNYRNYSAGKMASASLPALAPVVEAVPATEALVEVQPTTAPPTTIPVESTPFISQPGEETTTSTTVTTTTVTNTTSTTTTTIPVSNGAEPAPSIKMYFSGRLYTQVADFSVPSNPEIKIEVLAQSSYELREDISHYSLIIDGNVRCPLQVESFSANKIVLKAVLDPPLAPGRHVCTVMARSSGMRAAATSAALEAVVTVSEGNVLLEPLRTFPNPWDPKNGNLALQYYLNKPAPIEISIYKIDGQIVKKSFVNEQERGRRQWTWDGKTDAGEPVSSGMYMVIIASQGEMLAKSRIMVVR